jgi:phosphoribosylamine-glycine ligase
MRLLFVSKNGDFGGILARFKEQGATCAMYIKTPACKELFDGIYDKVEYIKDLVAWKPDVVLFDGTELSSEAEALKGIPCINGNKEINLLEENRKFGFQEMLNHDILLPDTFSMPSITEAIKFLGESENKKERWVFKEDDIGLPALTIVEKEKGQLVRDLERNIRRGLLPRSIPCILQKFVEGIEIDFEAWCVDGKIIYPLHVTVEEKKLIAGDLGPSTGCASSVSWEDDPENPSKIAKQGILKMAPCIAKHRYNGQIAFNQIVAEDKVYGLEFSTRPGFVGTYLTWSLMKGSWIDTLEKWCRKELEEIQMQLDKVAGGITFGIYPYPLKVKETELGQKVFAELCKGAYITDIDSDLYKNPDFFWVDVKREEHELVCAGSDGLFAYNGIVGRKIKQVMDDVVEDGKLFHHINELIFKTDGVSRIEKVRELVRNGMLSWMPK